VIRHGPTAAALRERHAAVSRTGEDVARLRRLLADASASRASVPFDRWQQFAASTVTTDQILAALPTLAF
jgi:hypothetical protein